MNINTQNVTVSNEETQKRHGRLYRVSGNLFICKATSRTIPHNFINTSRGNIHEFSADAARRMRRYLRECRAEYTNMVTLTYPGFFDSDGKTTKEHLRRFLQELKREVELFGDADSGYSTFWFLEFQERGAPHFHLFTTHFFKKHFIANTWYRIVHSEDPRHLAAGTRIEKILRGRSGLISYALKYAAKQCQKAVPEGYDNVGRFWGVSGSRLVVSADTFVSVDDSRVMGVKNLENTIVEAIKNAIREDLADEIVRKVGVGVWILKTRAFELKMRTLIYRLSAKTMKIPQTFEQAEIDND